MVKPAAQDRQICLLQYQIQQRLAHLRPERFEVRASDLLIDEGGAEFRPALSVFESIEPDSEPAVRWVINITDSCVPDDRLLDQQRHLCARLAIADYWLLTALSISTKNLITLLTSNTSYGTSANRPVRPLFLALPYACKS